MAIVPSKKYRVLESSSLNPLKDLPETVNPAVNSLSGYVLPDFNL